MDLELVLRTSALLLLASLITRVLIKAAPATRHLIWHIAIVIVLIAPVLAPVTPKFGVAIAQLAAETQVVERQLAVANGAPAADVLGTVSTTGALAAGLWFAMAWAISGWKVRRSVAAPAAWIAEVTAAGRKLGLPHPVEVRQFAEEGSPHVAGLFQSVVLMPASAEHWTREDRQAAFVHELTHIRRGDRRTQALAQLACAIYWFNPLVWQASAALARERERACDAEVLRLGARPSAYATLLLDLARATRPAWTPSAVLSMARPSAMEGRLLTILGAGSRSPWRTSRWLVAVGALVMTGVVLGAQPSARRETRSPAPSAAPQPAQTHLLDLDDRVSTPSSTPIDVVDTLVTALSDSDSQVREKAAIGLAFRRDPRVVAPLLTAMADDDSQVREKAAIALGASGDPRAFEALQRAVTDPDSQVREKAVAGLLLLSLRK